MASSTATKPAAKGASAPPSLFAQRLARLEQITILLRGLRRDLAQTKIAQIQQKAAIYNDNLHVSHGERQGIASAGTSQIATEILQLDGEIEVLEDERRFLELCIAWDESD